MFRKRTYLKVLVSTLVALFIHLRASDYVNFFTTIETSRVRGPLYGTCAPIEQLQDLNEEINPILTQLSVSIFIYQDRHSNYNILTRHGLIVLLLMDRALHTSRPSRWTWRRNARSGPSNACAIQTNALFASAMIRKYRCFGKSRRRKTRARCGRGAIATSWTSRE